MGKKSTGESPSVDEGGSLEQQLQEHLWWEEAVRNLLNLLEAKGTGSHQAPQRAPLGIRPLAWDYQDDSNFNVLGSEPKGIRYWVGGGEGVGRGGRWRCCGIVGRRLVSNPEE